MSGTLAKAGQRITAAWLNLNIPGPWQAITPLNGWTNQGGGPPTFQARQFNSCTLEVIGGIAAGTTTNGTQLGSIPVALSAPISNQSGTAVVRGGTATGNIIGIDVDSNRSIFLDTAATNVTWMFLHVFVALDT